ncbi:MAG: HAD family hydrolase [Candidatus Omnitrophota bacterium]
MDDKYVFLDRDGVINTDPGGWTEHGYVAAWKDFHFLPLVAEAIKKLFDAGYEIVIISNQQGVGKGYFTGEDLKDLTERMKRVLEEAGGKIRGVYYCTHRKEENCSCRKPKEGLFLLARKELGISTFEGKFYVGDTERDMQAGKKAGLKGILILSGKSEREDVARWECKPDYICRDLMEAVELILEKGEA